MANKKSIGLGVAAVAAAGAGAALAAKNYKKAGMGQNQGTQTGKGAGEKTQCVGRGRGKKTTYTDLNYRNTELGRFDKNSKGIYIPMAITKPLQDHGNQKGWRRRMRISWAAVSPLWQQPAFWYVTDRCQEITFIS